MNKRYNLLSTVSAALCAVLMVIMSTSCNSIIYDDLEPCPQGVRLRFVYDYNLEFVNAFPKKVDCLTLYIFDEQGNYLDRRVETTDVLKDENYRMVIDLEQGNYRMLAYGGLACEEHSFSVVNEPSAARSAYTDWQVTMDDGKLGTSLHPLFYGSLEVTVEGTDYVDATVGMMKNTNNIRIMLQQVNNDVPLDDSCFSFVFTDDNTRFASDNSLVPNGLVSYTPWSQGTVDAGTDEDLNDVKVAFAEFSTSRLVARTGTAPQLVVTNHETGKEIIHIPLINYLLLLKSELYAEMSGQEFLDRESEWSLIFFLNEEGNWLRTHIIVNDWVVRLNNTDF